MKKIYYVGDWTVRIGPIFAETPFNHVPKGLGVNNGGRWLIQALESAGEFKVTSVPTWDFYALEPGAYEKILSDYDAIIFSDVEAKNFQLSPQFFDRRLFGTKVLTFPDRVKMTTAALKAGTHMIFMGGWLSFTGELGKGGWGHSRLSEILPVTCLDFEDLRESTEGFWAEATVPKHPIFAGVDLKSMPPALGFNRVKARPGCQVLARWKGEGNPAIAVGQFGKGRVLAYTSDPCPHWGCNFVFWKDYPRLWANAARWLCSDQPAKTKKRK